MYVLIIARGYPTEKYKKNGIFEFDQAKALVSSGCKVVYAAIDIRSIRRWRQWGIEKRTIDGVKVYAINIPIGRIPEPLKLKMRIWGLNIIYKKILKEQGKPDLMHAHFAYMGYVASMVKEKLNLPMVMTEHLSKIIQEKMDKHLKHIANTAYRSADALITVSPALQKVIKKRFNHDALYVPNIVDTKLFYYTPKEASNTFQFTSIGSLITSKRIDLIAEAFAKVFKNNKNVKLTIFGEGPEKAKVEELIKKLSIEDQVQLMGQQSREKIANHLKKSDCFVLPSQYETFGVAYIEALASGVPVIATRCGGPEAFINESNGIMIPVDDSNELIRSMKKMHYENNKYDRECIAKETSELFSPDSIARKLKQIYKDVIKD